jgi:hypothetical protein
MRKLVAIIALLLLATPAFTGARHVAAQKTPRVSIARPPAPRKSTIRCVGCARDRRGRIKRSESAKAKFRRSNPCPSTGRTSGPCPGYAVDHRVPLYKGGADSPSNMQWLSNSAHKLKHSKR